MKKKKLKSAEKQWQTHERRSSPLFDNLKAEDQQGRGASLAAERRGRREKEGGGEERRTLRMSKGDLVRKSGSRDCWSETVWPWWGSREREMMGLESL